MKNVTYHKFGKIAHTDEGLFFLKKRDVTLVKNKPMRPAEPNKEKLHFKVNWMHGVAADIVVLLLLVSWFFSITIDTVALSGGYVSVLLCSLLFFIPYETAVKKQFIAHYWLEWEQITRVEKASYDALCFFYLDVEGVEQKQFVKFNNKRNEAYEKYAQLLQKYSSIKR